MRSVRRGQVAQTDSTSETTKAARVTARLAMVFDGEAKAYRAPTGFFGIGIRPSRWARLRASWRARRTASAF